MREEKFSNIKILLFRRVRGWEFLQKRQKLSSLRPTFANAKYAASAVCKHYLSNARIFMGFTDHSSQTYSSWTSHSSPAQSKLYYDECFLTIRLIINLDSPRSYDVGWGYVLGGRRFHVMVPRWRGEKASLSRWDAPRQYFQEPCSYKGRRQRFGTLF